MNNTPFWFLDIDGIINCFPQPEPHHIAKFGEYKHVQILPYHIWYSQRVIDFINRVNREGLAQTVWLTSWRDLAHKEFAPAVGLDEFPHLDSEGSNYCDDPKWWKNVALRTFMTNKSEAFVWTDDDISQRIRKAAKETFEGRCLVLTPMSQPGLEPDHLERIEEFLVANRT